MLKHFMIISVLFSLLSCTVQEKNYTIEVINGVKTYRNKNIPSTKDIVIKPVELFTINCEDNSTTDSTRIIKRFNDFDVDINNNIYISDMSNNTLKKFDSNGNYIKSFGGRGKGPGEVEMTGWMMVLKDTVIVDDYIVQDMLKFDADGNYLYKNRVNEPGPFERYQALTDDKIIGYQVYYKEEGEEVYMSYNLTIKNSNFTNYKEVAQKQILFNREKYNFFDMFLSAYATSDSLIYFAEKSDSKYKINVYDHEANHIYSIMKNYAKIPFSEEELIIFEKEYNNRWYFSNNKSKFKSAIIQMGYDKYERLWVISAIKRDETNKTDYLVDLFKDGVFLQQIKLDICPGYDFVNYDEQIILKRDRLYYINRKDQYLKVYSY
ncbi:MAG: hypothetical protein JXR69_10215 [Candidatus Delongbacteria bacterium]|nr:hypothetical protein [Candidatus Delongbacteria bacterium]